MTNHRFAQLFDGPPLNERSNYRGEISLAASIQAVTEEITKWQLLLVKKPVEELMPIRRCSP